MSDYHLTRRHLLALMGSTLVLPDAMLDESASARQRANTTSLALSDMNLKLLATCGCPSAWKAIALHCVGHLSGL